MSTGNSNFGVNAKVIANSGASAMFHEVDTVVRVKDGQQSVEYVRTGKLEARVLKLTNLNLAEIEDRFETVEDWTALVAARPNRTVISSLSILFALPEELISQMMMDGYVETYQFALTSAWIISVGADEQRLGKLVERANQISGEKTEAVQKMIDAMMTSLLVDVGPGTNTSEAGSESEGTSMNSGDSAPDKSVSSSKQSSTSDRPTQKARTTRIVRNGKQSGPSLKTVQ